MKRSKDVKNKVRCICSCLSLLKVWPNLTQWWARLLSICFIWKGCLPRLVFHMEQPSSLQVSMNNKEPGCRGPLWQSRPHSGTGGLCHPLLNRYHCAEWYRWGKWMPSPSSQSWLKRKSRQHFCNRLETGAIKALSYNTSLQEQRRKS